MPIYRNPFEKGNLFVKFDITFPPNKFADEANLKVNTYTTFYFCLKRYQLHFKSGGSTTTVV